MRMIRSSFVTLATFLWTWSDHAVVEAFLFNVNSASSFASSSSAAVAVRKAAILPRIHDPQKMQLEATKNNKAKTSTSDSNSNSSTTDSNSKSLTTNVSKADLEAKKIAELKQELKQRNLTVSGVKQVLVDRLWDDMMMQSNVGSSSSKTTTVMEPRTLSNPLGTSTSNSKANSESKSKSKAKPLPTESAQEQPFFADDISSSSSEPQPLSSSSSSILQEKIQKMFAKSPNENPDFDQIVQSYYPGAVSNKKLVSSIVTYLSSTRGFTPTNTLLATSLCCDELARQLETDFSTIYGKHFNLGGLSGFPFAGNTGFGAMAAHIPDDGFCLTVYGPHVGIAADGTVGKVERSGIALIDTCCGSAISAAKYLYGITNGGAKVNINIQSFTDFQQGVVQEMILPYGKRLSDASQPMVELPLALYESQDLLLNEIIQTGKGGIKRGFARLGGIQINTGPNTLDYFLPLRFEFMNYRGESSMDLLPELKEVLQNCLYDDFCWTD